MFDDNSTRRAIDSGAGHRLLAATMIGLGLLGFLSGDFAAVWQRIPIEHLPARQAFAYVTAAIELATGIGLLIPHTALLASRALLIFLSLWVVLLKLPAVLYAPQMEATWLGFAEIVIILTGAWVVFAVRAGSWERAHVRFAIGTRGVHLARDLFALSLPAIGLAHFFYVAQTAAMVPKWLPFPVGWAYFTGAGSIAASIAIWFGVVPRLAATLETAMLAIITVLVWTPGLTPAPNGPQFQATGFLISAAIAAGAWIMADSYRGAPWFRRARSTGILRNT